ncbi:MAG: glucosamine-6-phosphate deaminase [Bacteroidota bacterium]
MQIIISKDFESLSVNAALAITEIMTNKSNPLICVASGDSPSGIYKNIVASVKQKELDINQWHFLGLDEWVGLNGADEGSCRWHLNREIFNPLNIQEESICFFDGASNNLEQECAITESYIQNNGGIEIAILGLGMNGHIGMNEPQTPISSRSHVIELDAITIEVGQKYFNKPQPLTKGITLGIATLLEAKHILLIVTGIKKAGIVKQVIEDPISELIPASLLRNHPNCSIYLDEAAASNLSL